MECIDKIDSSRIRREQRKEASNVKSLEKGLEWGNAMSMITSYAISAQRGKSYTRLWINMLLIGLKTFEEEKNELTLSTQLENRAHRVTENEGLRSCFT